MGNVIRWDPFGEMTGLRRAMDRWLDEGMPRPWRMLGWAFVILYLTLTLINAKSYFLSPIFPTLYASGAILLDWKTEAGR